MIVYGDATVAVVVPAYNEEGHVGSVIETMPAFVDRIFVVEDGSTDGTWAEIEAATERVNAEFERSDDRYPDTFDQRVVAIRHTENRGVGGAIKTGYLAARDGGLDVTAVMGADGQMPPDLLADIVAPVADGRADYAKGNRLLEPAHHEEMPRFRYVGNRILSWLTRVASGYWTIGDPQNGFTAISLSALHAIDVEEMYEYYGYCNDLLVRLNVAGMRVVDVPRPATYADEESHIDFGEYVPRVSSMLFGTFLWRLRTKYMASTPHPVALLYVGALLVGVASVLSATVAGPAPPTSIFTGLLLGASMLVGALTWDRAHERHLDGRLADETESDGSPHPASGPFASD